MKSLLSTIYKKLPAIFQDVMISFYGAKLKRQRYGEQYWNYLDHYKRKTYPDLREEKENQISELKELLNYAISNSPFYAELYSGIDLDQIRSVEDMSGLPVVNKEDIRANSDSVYTIPERDAIVSYTGGTTGKSLKVLFRLEDVQKRMAYLDAFKYRVGVDVHKLRKATFSGRNLIYRKRTKRLWRNNWAYKQRLYSTFHITEENLPVYINNLNKFKPEVLNGFVSAIYELAEYINRKNIVLTFTLKGIFTTSETLLAHHRESIEKAFDTKVYDQYASAEGAPFITQCAEGNLHFNMDTGVIETNVKSEMIVTSFTSYGTPLIRYNIGDLLVWKDGVCKCGSCHPLVESIEGRKVDYLYKPDGGKVSMSHLADVIKGIPNSITKMQFIQTSPARLQVLYEADHELLTDAHKESMMKELRYRFGDEMIYTDHIPKEKSGKFSLIKNSIS